MAVSVKTAVITGCLYMMSFSKVTGNTTYYQENTTVVQETTTLGVENTTVVQETTTLAVDISTARQITLCNIVEGSEFTMNTTSRHVGVYVKIGCVEYHELIGPDVIRCNENGDWSSRPECRRVCLKFRDKRLIKDTESVSEGTLVTVSCPDGYELVGPNVYYCQTYGLWNTTRRPKCRSTSHSIPLHIIVISVVASLITLAVIIVLAYILYTNSQKAKQLKRQREEMQRAIAEKKEFQAVTQDSVGMPIVTLHGLNPELKGRTETSDSLDSTSTGREPEPTLQNQDDKVKSMMF